MISRATTFLAAAMLAVFAGVASADLSAYNQNFESMVQADGAALSNDGWVVYGNVFNSTHTAWYYGYGPFPAPNPGLGFSALANGQGGPLQGNLQLNIYSDYNNGDHNNGNLVEANVYREMTVGAADVGKTVLFQFDAKRNDWTGATYNPTAGGFIKTLNPSAGWAMTNYLVADMTNAPQTWGTYSLTLYIDSGLVGQILQFGFTSTATHYDPTGVFYDNILFAPDLATPSRHATWGELKNRFTK